MIKSRTLHFLVAAACSGLLAYALYLQHVEGMQPCPLCVMQRYAFTLLGLICLICCIGNAPKLGAGFGLAASLAGAAVAGRHLWVKAHPGLACGVDPLEAAMNYLITSELLPQMFLAEGMCAAELPPILFLSIPTWSLIWFLLFSVVMVFILARREVKFV